MRLEAVRFGVNMKLISIKIFPIGKSGWGSDLLEFGTHITQLFGPNGCGKTPIVQSIAFCLGYPCQFRKDIYDNCGYAILKVETHSGTFDIRRVYSRDVDITVSNSNGEIQRFYEEKTFSSYLFYVLDITYPNLVGNNNQVTNAYLSTILPLFYLDQDEGYSKIYCPPSGLRG